MPKEIGLTAIYTSLLGFEFDGFTDPGYFWTNGKGEKLTRYSTRKDLIAKTEDEKKLTETQIMRNKGYYKCYDSGNLKFHYTI